MRRDAAFLHGLLLCNHGWRNRRPHFSGARGRAGAARSWTQFAVRRNERRNGIAPGARGRIRDRFRSQRRLESRRISEAGSDRRCSCPSVLPRRVRMLKRFRPRAVFSMGGYVAGPVMIAAIVSRHPSDHHGAECSAGIGESRGSAERSIALCWASNQLADGFRESKCEVTGLPVRPEFFRLKRSAGAHSPY